MSVQNYNSNLVHKLESRNKIKFENQTNDLCVFERGLSSFFYVKTGRLSLYFGAVLK